MRYTYDCAYFSLEQCMARASGISNNCVINEWSVSEPAAPRRLRRAPRR